MAPTRKNIEAAAKRSRVAIGDLAHQDDATFGKVVAYRTGQEIAAAARRIVELLDLSNDAHCLADYCELHNDGDVKALQDLVGELEAIGIAAA